MSRNGGDTRNVGATPDVADPTWDRLVEQIDWYNRKSGQAQRAYKRAKIVQVVVIAGVPVGVAAGAPAVLTATLGAVVLILEAVQQLFQWQTNWVLYRSTTEALKHERYLYLAHAGPYVEQDRHRVLAEQIEGLVSQEHAKWTQVRHGPEDGGVVNHIGLTRSSVR